SALDVEVEIGIEKGAQRALDRRSAVGLGVVGVERGHAPRPRDHRAAREHRVEQLLLVDEVVVEQRVMRTHAPGHVLERHAVQAVLGEQVLRRVEDLLDLLGALLQFRWALACLQLVGHSTTSPTVAGGSVRRRAWQTQAPPYSVFRRALSILPVGDRYMRDTRMTSSGIHHGATLPRNGASNASSPISAES